MEKIEEEICRIIGGILGKEPKKISRNDSWRDLELDSVQCLEMVMEVEDSFHIIVGDEEGESFATVADVIACVAEKKNMVDFSASVETTA